MEEKTDIVSGYTEDEIAILLEIKTISGKVETKVILKKPITPHLLLEKGILKNQTMLHAGKFDDLDLCLLSEKTISHIREFY